MFGNLKISFIFILLLCNESCGVFFFLLHPFRSSLSSISVSWEISERSVFIRSIHLCLSDNSVIGDLWVFFHSVFHIRSCLSYLLILIFIHGPFNYFVFQIYELVYKVFGMTNIFLGLFFSYILHFL